MPTVIGAEAYMRLVSGGIHTLQLGVVPRSVRFVSLNYSETAHFFAVLGGILTMNEHNPRWMGPSTPPLREITMADMFDETADRFPNNDGLVCPGSGRRWTYAELKDTLNKVARGLMAMGVKKGDHVAIWATNVPEWVLTQFATAKIGAVLVTVNTAYKQFELEYLLEQSDSTTLVMIGGIKDKMAMVF